jgi:para-aminobenzoate synthetase component 1
LVSQKSQTILPKFTSNFTKRAYFRAIQKALQSIAAGDIYQVNLSQRFSVRSKQEIDSITLYQTLRTFSPSDFGCYFDTGHFKIISSSPERFLNLKGRTVVTSPMKGTRRRGKSFSEDRKLRREMINSEKDKAELLMVTDLERNDLGRVCEFGSVKVKKMREVERYRFVYQTTSTVEGKLRRDKDAFDLLQACFPSGSITGCPKIRAMKIIEELEPTRRSFYTGSLGYISVTGDMDFNVLIRTLLVKPRDIYFQVGGGIVADSKPEDEYRETLVKAEAMRLSLKKILQSDRKI